MKNLKKILVKAVPLWMVIAIVINTSMVMGVAQYYFFRQQMQKNLQALAKTTKSPEELAQVLKQEVLPQKGYMTPLKWKNLLKKLVEVGAIDRQKYAQEANYLDTDPESNMQINEANAQFMVNTLWALGLVNKSKVLDEGPMKKGNTPTANFASTAGWTLGAKPAMELYS
ncbi:MAG: hypothetical protein Q8Q91_02440, partial [Candidatus Daviesbacteria bacterium]|nr:hypothetical protein [Candidatus Daviesbacteria bacterium]